MAKAFSLLQFGHHSFLGPTLLTNSDAEEVEEEIQEIEWDREDMKKQDSRSSPYQDMKRKDSPSSYKDTKRRDSKSLNKTEETDYDYCSDCTSEESNSTYRHSSRTSKRERQKRTSEDKKHRSTAKVLNCECAKLKDALKKEREARAALEKTLEKELAAKAAQEKALKKKSDDRAILKEKVESIKSQMATLKDSLKKEQRNNAKLKCKVDEMAHKLEKDQSLIKKLQEDLATSSSCLKEHDKKALAELQEVKDQLTQQQKESLDKNNEISSLHCNILNLQSDIEAKDKLVDSWTEKAKQLASEAKEERIKVVKLQKDIEVALSHQQEKAEEFDRLTHKNQSMVTEIQELTSAVEAQKANAATLQYSLKNEARELHLQIQSLQKDIGLKDALLRQKDQKVSELSEKALKNKTLQNDLGAAQTETQLALKQLEESRALCNNLEEKIVKLQRVCKREKQKNKELSEQTLDLEKSLTSERFLNSSLKEKQTQLELTASENQTKIKDLTCLTHQLADSLQSECAVKHSLICDMQKQEKENEDMTVKLKAMESKHESLLSQHRLLSDLHREHISAKNTIADELKAFQSENTTRKTELEDTLKESRTRQTELEDALKESKTRQTELEDALKEEQKHSAEFQKKADRFASALKEEKAKCESYHTELKETLYKQIKTVEERGQLTVALKRANETCSMLQQQQVKCLTEMAIQSRQLSGTELKFNMEKAALEQKITALNQLQKENQELGRKNKDLHSDYCDLFMNHRALQGKYERLSGVQDQHQPEVHLSMRTCLSTLTW
ncbi:MAR-binding filament-like protein 1-1 [Myripristis murdjan]|uniref:MAR-binding filament-like protein 1-1 n=1 Tax=Myripristis murdjan TaxID=586833 RepID=UPI001175E459|nr:MAR-binding filament-like protein 1-1 [Myripristis murdjan]